MEPIDLVPSGYRFLPTAEELLVDYLANWVAGAPLPGRAVAFADVYGTEPWNLLGSDRQEGYFFAERKPKNSGGSRVDRKAGSGSWTLYKKQETVKSMVGGREMVFGRKSCLSFNDGRRKNSGWTMYEFEMCSSGGFETRSDVSPHPTAVVQSDVSPPPTAVVQHPSLAPAVTPPPPESHLSSVDSVAPNEAGVAAASPSSTDVGGALTTIPKASPPGLVDLLSMPDDTRIDSTTVADVSSSSSSIDFVACEQMHSTDDDFFVSRERVHASLMSDDTIPASVMYGTSTDSTTIAAASSSSSIEIVGCEQTENIDDNDDFMQWIEALVKSDDTPIDSTMTSWLDL
ncbi:NAC domain-containing protein 91-like [Musa acuminata AAA Group]|uniref:NAC domain-containing protein 91-like n=1 Tax=Musa acuminata AAA Group TaxID=214697 RepID=UPI0031DDA11C